eukprot:CAMPEP_0116879062 /NCGR_PEP_ID=MMETSP0463-20121206/10811_1 /TAXON_ID=181622 /ORGANISM="Strombidinopsis sp, Strain SopsisLIS2011" /LENGTH=424 /DNA_ID=CAMNT_0004527905 /DNA_START=192 /DNA_END=1466 /DNA_ORIENTATION=-
MKTIIKTKMMIKDMPQMQTKTVSQCSTRTIYQEANLLVVEARTLTLVVAAMVLTQTIKTIAAELPEVEDIIRAIIIMNLINQIVITNRDKTTRKWTTRIVINKTCSRMSHTSRNTNNVQEVAEIDLTIETHTDQEGEVDNSQLPDMSKMKHKTISTNNMKVREAVAAAVVPNTEAHTEEMTEVRTRGMKEALTEETIEALTEEMIEALTEEMTEVLTEEMTEAVDHQEATKTPDSTINRKDNICPRGITKLGMRKITKTNREITKTNREIINLDLKDLIDNSNNIARWIMIRRIMMMMVQDCIKVTESNQIIRETEMVIMSNTEVVAEEEAAVMNQVAEEMIEEEAMIDLLEVVIVAVVAMTELNVVVMKEAVVAMTELIVEMIEEVVDMKEEAVAMIEVVIMIENNHTGKETITDKISMMSQK